MWWPSTRRTRSCPRSPTWPRTSTTVRLDVECWRTRFAWQLTYRQTSNAWQKCGNLLYAITYNVIWANHKTESFEYHWLHTLAMFDVTSFAAIMLGIGPHFKFCRYVNSFVFTCQSSSWKNIPTSLSLIIGQKYFNEAVGLSYYYKNQAVCWFHCPRSGQAVVW